MAFARLSQASRIWLANGLGSLLAPGDLPPGQSLLDWRGEDPRQAKAPPQAIRQRPPSQGQAWEQARATRQPQPLAPQPAPEAPRKTPAWRLLPLEEWPAQWRERLAQSRKGRFAWTYMDLGADLLRRGAGDEEGEAASQRRLRGDCLRRLFADLGHPGGTHAFWPIALPDQNGALAPNVDCFWSGLERLECRGVVILGSQAAQAALGTKDLKPLTQLFKCGKLVWILWEAHVMAGNPAAYAKALAFLRRSLANFIRI